MEEERRLGAKPWDEIEVCRLPIRCRGKGIGRGRDGKVVLSRTRLLTASRSSLGLFLAALPIFTSWPGIDASYMVISAILVSIIVPGAQRIGGSMEQVKICLASGILGFLCSIPLQYLVWISRDTAWIGVFWLIIVGFFGAVWVSWLDPKMSSLPILRLSLLFVALAVTFSSPINSNTSPTSSPQPNSPSSTPSQTHIKKHLIPSFQLAIAHLWASAIALLLAIPSPFVSTQINRDFANLTQNCKILFEEMCDQLRLTKQDSMESDAKIREDCEELNLLEYDAMRRNEEKKVRNLEIYLTRRLKVLKITLASEAKLELWADATIVDFNLAIYANLDRLLKDFIQMRLALETGFIPRLSLILIRPLLPNILKLKSTTREYLEIIESQLNSLFDPDDSNRNKRSMQMINIVHNEDENHFHPSLTYTEGDRDEKRKKGGKSLEISDSKKMSSSKVPYSDRTPSSSIVQPHHSSITSDSDANINYSFFSSTDDDHFGLQSEETDTEDDIRIRKSGIKHHHKHGRRDGIVDSPKLSFDPPKDSENVGSMEIHEDYEEEDHRDDDDDMSEEERRRRRKKRKERRLKRHAAHHSSHSYGKENNEGLMEEGDGTHIASSSSKGEKSKGNEKNLKPASTSMNEGYDQDSSMNGKYHHGEDEMQSKDSSSSHPRSKSGREEKTENRGNFKDIDTKGSKSNGFRFNPSSEVSKHSKYEFSSSSMREGEETKFSKSIFGLSESEEVETETMKLSKRTAAITQAISRSYVQNIKDQLERSELKLSPTAELTRLNFFLWRIAELRKRLKSLEHAVSFQRRHVRQTLGRNWIFSASLRSLLVPFFSLFQGLFSVVYLSFALFIRFILWALHPCFCKTVKWENLKIFNTSSSTRPKINHLDSKDSIKKQSDFENAAVDNNDVQRYHPFRGSISTLPSPLNSPNTSAIDSKHRVEECLSDLEVSNEVDGSEMEGKNQKISIHSPSSKRHPSTTKQSLKDSRNQLSSIQSTLDSSSSIVGEGGAKQKIEIEKTSNSGHQTSRRGTKEMSRNMTSSGVYEEEGKEEEEAVEVTIELPEPKISKVGHFRLGKGVTISDHFMKDWIKRGGWKFACRFAVALAVSASIAMAFQLYVFPTARASWACVTVLIVFVPELGGTMKRVWHRVFGTVGGAAVALFSALFAKYTHPYLVFGPYLIFTFIVSYAQHSVYKPRPYTWTVANFTFAIIILLSWPFTGTASSIALLAGYRALQVLLGCFIVVVVAYWVVPERAEDSLRIKLASQAQMSVHAFVEMVALTHSAIQETGKITNLVQRTWDAIFPCSQLLKLAKAEQISIFTPSQAKKKRDNLCKITWQLENISDTLVQMHDTLRAGFSPQLRHWISPYCDLLTRAVLFIEEDALLVYSFLSTGQFSFRPEPTRIPAILSLLDTCYLELRSSNPNLADLYPEAFRWNAFMHTAREFIVSFSNLVFYVTEPEHHNQLIHLYSR